MVFYANLKVRILVMRKFTHKYFLRWGPDVAYFNEKRYQSVQNDGVGEDKDSGELVGEHELHHRQDDLLHDVQLRIPEKKNEGSREGSCFENAITNQDVSAK